ncbi:hypothetical protein [Streptomyces sp. NPDC058728]|uniref:hypothetical protein n=1 Tax=Streptomyces sp. NPDC058728 TaxID=3346612 RepID=UPI00368344DE
MAPATYRILLRPGDLTDADAHRLVRQPARIRRVTSDPHRGRGEPSSACAVLMLAGTAITATMGITLVSLLFLRMSTRAGELRRA